MADAPALLPLDDHNRRLRDAVRPPDWANPEPRGRYHLVVLGAGTGGLVTAAIGAALGARVALVERALMGGDCLNVGCVPSKAVLRAARGWCDARSAAARFGGPAAHDEGDFGAAMERMRGLRAAIAPVDGARRFRDELGVDVFLGEGRFLDGETLEVDGRRLRFHRCVIATGGRPAVPSIPGLEAAGCLTNETVFSLTELPPRLVVVGGGPIGCELAQAFARFGSHVTLLQAGERILSEDDTEASEVVGAALRHDGVHLVTGAAVERVETHAGEHTLHYRAKDRERQVNASHILVATGRAANVEGIGLEAAGVEVGGAGVRVDDRLRTTSPRIYAVGDVCSPQRFTHAADAQARLVVRNALFFGRGRASRLIVPRCTYTTPELAHVGLTARDAAARGAEVQTLTIPMREVDRARLDGADEGFLRVYLKAGSDRIVGATLVAEHAGDLISQITQAMVAGIGLGRLGDAIFPYPTQAEVIRKAADAWRRTRLTPRAKSLFGMYFRLFG